MDLGFPVITVAIVIVIIYLLSSIKILAEYERGAWTPAGHGQGSGRNSGLRADRPHGADLAAAGSA